MTEESSTCDGEGARWLPGVRYFEIGGGAVIQSFKPALHTMRYRGT
jgi:hypothetical protein